MDSEQQPQSAMINLHVRRCTPHLKYNLFGCTMDESYGWKAKVEPSGRRALDAAEPVGPHFERPPLRNVSLSSQTRALYLLRRTRPSAARA